MVGLGTYTTIPKEETYTSCLSKTYKLQDIISYLQECMAAPQYDTKVTFEVLADGTLKISTSNDTLPGEIEASGFVEVE